MNNNRIVQVPLQNGLNLQNQDTRRAIIEPLERRVSNNNSKYQKPKGSNLKEELKQKAVQPQRNSYMYAVPILEPKVVNQLNSFLIPQIKDDQQSDRKEAEKDNYTKMKETFQNINLNLWYLFSMTSFELFLGLLYIIGILTDGLNQRIGLSIVIGVFSIIYLVLVVYLTWKLDLIDKYWGSSWLGLFVTFSGISIGGGTGIWYISLATTLFMLMVLAWMLASQRKTCFTFFYLILLCFILIISSLIFSWIIEGQKTNQNMTVAAPYLVFLGLGLLKLGYELFQIKWQIRTKHQKWQIVCSIYLLSIVLAVSLSLGIPGELFWVWFSQVTNFVFVCSIIYFFFFVADVNCGKSRFAQSIWEKIKKCIRRDKDPDHDFDPNILYQKADVLLTPDKSFYSNPRQSMVGKPLSECINCYNQQSRFCYQKCLHVCVGYQCVLYWLKKGIKKCPLCRQLSEVMLEIKRVRDRQFLIMNKYKLKGLQ